MVAKATVIAGPFSLRYHHLFIRERSPGVFILSRNGRSADFVGGSVEDVAGTMRRVGRESGYRYFWFAYASSAEECLQLEHAWYHRYSPPDNAAPPAASQALRWRCSTPGCAACALIRTRR